MTVRDALASIGMAAYDPGGSRDQQILRHLDALSDEIRHHLPAHYLVTVSKGIGALPLGLWVAVLDPEVTRSPTRGIYVVYLFDAERRAVSLSLNQGVTAATESAHAIGVRSLELLRQEAEAMRALLSSSLEGLESRIDLGRSDLLRKYAAGSVVAVTWPLNRLPSDGELATELARFLDLYTDVVARKEQSILAGTGPVSMPARDAAIVVDRRQPRFEPKDASDYVAHIGALDQVRSRSHEDLVRRLGLWARERGLTPNTNVHPRDLMLHGAGRDFLVEVKVFAAGRPSHAIRECIGQLYEYREFFLDETVVLVAALSANPGAAYLDLLSHLGIAAMWATADGWGGSALAHQFDLVDQLRQPFS
jgi:MrcB-like, N-terminal domain